MSDEAGYMVSVGDPTEEGALNPAADHVVDSVWKGSLEEAKGVAEDYARHHLSWVHKTLAYGEERWQARVGHSLGAEIKRIGPPPEIVVSVGTMS